MHGVHQVDPPEGRRQRVFWAAEGRPLIFRQSILRNDSKSLGKPQFFLFVLLLLSLEGVGAHYVLLCVTVYDTRSLL